MNITRVRPHDRDGQQGQVLVVVVLGLIAMIAMLGLIIDGGYAFAQQRGSQNGADSSATAGALVIAQNLPFRPLGQAGPKTDTDVSAAVSSAASGNKISTYNAYYTNLAGSLINAAGAAVGSTASAAKVGGGTLPIAAWGVQVDANKTFDTFFARAVGINSMTSTTTAVAVAGYVENAGAGNVLPVTIPLDIITCDNNGVVVTQLPPTYWPTNTRVILPLCKGDANGNVGWLSWDPPAGGTKQLIQDILHPSNPAVPVPSWQFVTSTGNVNSSSVEDALNTYAGKTVLLPFFDNACTLANTADNSACPTTTGHGQNNWYHFPLFFGFKMQSPKAAYMSGSDPECGTAWAGAGCVIGEIVSYVGPNVTVGAGTGTSLDVSSAIGVQLIR